MKLVVDVKEILQLQHNILFSTIKRYHLSFKENGGPITNIQMETHSYKTYSFVSCWILRYQNNIAEYHFRKASVQCYCN